MLTPFTASGKEFNNAKFDLQTFKLEDGGNEKYFALLKPRISVALKPKEGEHLWISFEVDGIPTNERWAAKVVAPLRPYLSGEINLILCRPRQAHPIGTSNFDKVNEILDFVETDLTSGEIAGLSDELTFTDLLESTPKFLVNATVSLSETTARRQADAIEAMQRGARYNIRKRPGDETYIPWTECTEIMAFREFLLLKTSIPKKRTNWLGSGIRFVSHLQDADQLDAINNLFCNAPEHVGVLVGPAGTGKTVLMSTMIMAHTMAHNQPHIVAAPSNVGGEVAAGVILSFFNSKPGLQGKIVLRAFHEASNGASNQAESYGCTDMVGTYSADGWSDETDRQTKTAIKDFLNVIKKCVGVHNAFDDKVAALKMSLSYHSLCTAGFTRFPANRYTKLYKSKFGAFRTSMAKLVKNGENALNAEEMRTFGKDISSLFAYTIKHTTVLVGTLTYLATKVYVENFQNPLTTFWTDEAGQSSIPDWLNVVARYRFQQSFLLGDPNQLFPVVVGPSPLTGFMRSLETSPMQLLLDASWPSVMLTDNRRSAKGIIEIPSKMFYEGKVKPHPNSADLTKHVWSIPVGNLIHETFKTEGDGKVPGAIAFFSSPSPSQKDKLTSSSFNLGNLAFCLNFVEKCVVGLKVPPQDIGYTSPYQAQCKKMTFALRKMELAYKQKGQSHAFSVIKVAPIDSYQGGSRKIMIGDYTSSDKLGFMTARGRNCVLLTRAGDFALYIGNKAITSPRDEAKNYPRHAFELGGIDNVSRDLSMTHAWMKHELAA